MLHQPQPLDIMLHNPLRNPHPPSTIPQRPLLPLHRPLRTDHNPGQRRLAAWSYGTKTPYIPPTILEPLTPYPSFDRPKSSARLIHVSLIARHGTRNPTRSSLDRMISLHSWLRAALPSPQPDWLDRWEDALNLYADRPGDITTQGVQELCQIGNRFAQNYGPSLDMAGGPFRIRSSYKNRAIESARSFLAGYLQTSAEMGLRLPLLHHDSAAECDLDSDPGIANLSVDSSSESSAEDDPVQVLPMGRDASLRYFDSHHHNEYATFATQYKAQQRRGFSQSLMRHIVTEMANRVATSLEATIPMDLDLLRVIGEVCAFENAHGRAATSPFFRLLTPGDARVLEMAEIRHRPFFKAHERFRAAAAPLVQDIMTSLTACIGGSTETPPFAADLRFAHAETLVPLLLLLGIDTNGLSPDDPDFYRGLSAMSPFAANLAIELYETMDGSRSSYFVRFRLHERYVDCIPALGEQGRNGIVELDHLLVFFGEVLDEGMQYFA